MTSHLTLHFRSHFTTYVCFSGTAKLALESTDLDDDDDDVIVRTEGDLERPNRSKGTLNPTQTKRLAAIFGIQ